MVWLERPPSVFVGVPAEPHEPSEWVLLRRRVDLGRVPRDEAPMRCTSDGRHLVCVNGVEVARGPMRSQPGTLHWDEADIGPLLHPGVNEVEVLVRHYGRPVPWWSPSQPYGEAGRGGFCMEVRGLGRLLDTGEGWEARPAGRTSSPPTAFGPPNETVDAVALADEAAWRPAEVLLAWLPTTPFTVVAPPPMRPLIEDDVDLTPIARGPVAGDLAAQTWPRFPTDPTYAPRGRLDLSPMADASLPVRIGDGEGVVLDAGGVTLGIVELAVSAAPGASVVLRSAERLDEAGHPVDLDRQWRHTHVCAGTPGGEVVTPFEAVGLRYLQVVAEGGPVELEGACVRERRAPLDRVGSFCSDDPELDAIWAMGRRTLEVCASDAHLDCPTREQRSWLGDAYLHVLLALTTSTDSGVAARILRLAASARRDDGLLAMTAAGDLAVGPLTIPDFSLHWVRGLARAWERTGDLALVDDLLPVAAPALDWWWRHVDGDGVVGPVPGWSFIEWVPTDTSQPTATLQCLLACALDDHATLCDAAGHERAAARSRARADRLRKGLGAFADDRAGVREELGSPLRSQHATAMAVLARALTGDRAGAALDHVCDPRRALAPVFDPTSPRGWALPDGFDREHHVLAAQPFFAHHLHQALAAAGRHELMIGSIRRWAPFLSTGDGTFWEHWPEQGREHSHAHAWAATPTFDLTAHVLGVQPALPGWDLVDVCPSPGPLRRLSGRVPTRHGRIDVDLALGDDGRWGGEVVLPPGTAGRFRLGPVDAVLGPGANAIG